MYHPWIRRVALGEDIEEIVLSLRVELPVKAQNLAVGALGVDDVEMAVRTEAESTKLPQPDMLRHAMNVERGPAFEAIPRVDVDVVQRLLGVATMERDVPATRHQDGDLHAPYWAALSWSAPRVDQFAEMVRIRKSVQPDAPWMSRSSGGTMRSLPHVAAAVVERGLFGRTFSGDP